MKKGIKHKSTTPKREENISAESNVSLSLENNQNEEVKKTNIRICMPNTGTINTLTVASLLNLRMPDNCIMGYNMLSQCLVHEARDRQVRESLEDNTDYIFFVDSDMLPPPETIKQLLSHNKDIVSAMCFKRIPPFQPCFYTKARLHRTEKGELKTEIESAMYPETWAGYGLAKMEAVGMACCLVKMDVFKKIGNTNWFFPLPQLGEDLAFCMKARQAGAEIYVDLGLNCHHLGIVPFGKEHYQESLRAFYSDPKNKDKNIFNELDQS
jgi:hypothetical protein